MRCIQIGLITLLLAMLPAFTHAAEPVDPAPTDKPAAGDTAAEKTPPPPSFQPGAQVVLAVTLKAPRSWNLNYLVPVRLQFGKEYLKTAPFKVKKDTWDTTIESYLPEYTVEIPLALAKDLEDGSLSIPIEVMCSVCEASGEQCTFAMETMQPELIVRNEAGEDDEENQALAEGTLEYSYRLSLP